MKLQHGYTLIELMIVVAIVAILAAVAIPSYRDYVIRGKIPEATSILSSNRVKMEQYFQDNHTYANSDAVGAPCAADTSSSKNFDFSCPAANLGAATYLIQATGKGQMAGFTYTIDQGNNKSTTITSTANPGWTISGSTGCWVIKAGGNC